MTDEKTPRERASEGAAPEFVEFEKTFRAPHEEQPRALQKVIGPILFDELDRRASVIAAQAAELADLRKRAEVAEHNAKISNEAACIAASLVLKEIEHPQDSDRAQLSSSLPPPSGSPGDGPYVGAEQPLQAAVRAATDEALVLLEAFLAQQDHSGFCKCDGCRSLASLRKVRGE